MCLEMAWISTKGENIFCKGAGTLLQFLQLFVVGKQTAMVLVGCEGMVWVRAVVLKLEFVLESLVRPVKARATETHPQSSDLVSLELD